jgi:hypothetical protein
MLLHHIEKLQGQILQLMIETNRLLANESGRRNPLICIPSKIFLTRLLLDQDGIGLLLQSVLHSFSDCFPALAAKPSHQLVGSVTASQSQKVFPKLPNDTQVLENASSIAETDIAAGFAVGQDGIHRRRLAKTRLDTLG